LIFLSPTLKILANSFEDISIDDFIILFLLANIVIITKDLSKKYDKITGIKDLNLTIKDGTIFGLIGPNGSGKTTTLKILSCLLKPTSGTATINTFDVQKNKKEIKTIVSYLPEEVGLYEEMEVREYLMFFADLHSISKTKSKDMIRNMAKKLDMDKRLDSKISTLSKGMRRKVALMRTLLPEPQILFLDELTEGIDPITRKMLIDWVKEMNKNGKTIIYSTHNLHEAEMVCSEVGILNKGKLIAFGAVNQLKTSFRSETLEDVFFKAIKYKED